MIYKITDISQRRFDTELYQKAYLAMSPERRAKADRYKDIADKRRCVFADMLLREMLRDNFSVAEPKFYTDDKGKPHLTGGKAHFSISHSGDYIACAADKQPVGIDIEQIRTVDLPLIKRVCTDEELSFVLRNTKKPCINADTCERFLRVWCAKEAYLKYTGEGIRGGLKSIGVANENGMKKHLFSKLALDSFTASGYVCAIVSEAKNKWAASQNL